ncbi:MAG: hypothetical protein UY32_C0009G0012 [Candidatus Jorgensenbacteria bacterium GW2011_GWC1_48_8]|uniref:DedA family protein n=2 Tax=Candidatus Joergenseniibacteriota TaxID=1752739 RepID=A0A0G1W7E7_9BACT|nr:MAG: hypothetical protein UY32_C0009G0012 [Candidatus Jorgensenbacteria bacterium GW2011_GWC1_48_8]KKW14608.1 MAG: hypothetical protein UY55_C0006G0017 [Candidatus Jorgensenbacteria bacterium GW2011_GWB1_50_10]
MTPLLENLGEWILNNYSLRHLILAVGVVVQGEITILIAVYLILRNYLGWGGFLLAIGIGLLVYEAFFYILGRMLQDTERGLRLKEKILRRPMMRVFLHNHADKFLVLSKFIVYVNVGVIMLSGLMNISAARFIRGRLAANVLWAGSMVAGSFLILSGLTLLKLHQIEIAMLVLLVAIFGFKHLVKKIIGKEVRIEEKAETLGEKIGRITE